MASPLYGPFALPVPANAITSSDIATTTKVGVVKSVSASSSNANKVTVAADGTMSIGYLDPSTLTGAVGDSNKLGGVSASDILVQSSGSSTAKVKNAAAADALATAITFTIGSSTDDGYGQVTGQTLSSNVTIPFALKTQSGLSAGTYTKVTVNSKGVITAATTLSATDIPTLTMAKISDAGALATKDTVSESDFDTTLAAKAAIWDTVSNKADAATTLAGYGITDAYTKTEVDGLISGALHYKGTYTTFAELTAAVAAGTITPADGDVYNITTAGGTDSRGTSIKAGDNVAAYNVDTSTSPVTCSWDVLGGTTDLSAYLLSATAASTYATITNFNALNEEVMGSDGTGATSGIKATVTKLDGADTVSGSVRQLIKAAKEDLAGDIEDITETNGIIDTRIATHNSASGAHSTLFAAKQNKAINASASFAVSDFVANTDTSVGATYMASKTISALSSAKDYVCSLSVAPASVATVLAAKFIAINKVNAGVLTVYCDVVPTASVTLNGLFTEIQ